MIKLFPGLPSFLKVGDALCFDGDYYSPENKSFEIGIKLKQLFFKKETVENNPEYFKLVEDVNFEIIKICGLPDLNFGVGVGVGYYYTPNLKITEVIRLNDMKTFSIGSYVKNSSKQKGTIHKIESFKVSKKQKNRTEFYGPDCIYVTYENNEGGNWLDNLILIDVVLETEDKYKLCLGDFVYRVVMNEHGNNNILFTEHINENFTILPNSTYFGDEFNAKMYIDLNSIKYSYKDILNACSNDDITVQQREEFGLVMFKTIIDLRKLNK